MDIDNNGFFDADTQRALDIYNSATKRKPLTDEELSRLEGTYIGRRLARAIEAAHGIKEES